MAITDLSDLVNKLTGGNNGNPENLFGYINNRVAGAAATTPVAGRYIDLWEYESTLGGAGAVPTTAVITTRATNGAFGQQNATGGRKKIALGYSIFTNIAGSYMLYDRLTHMGGLSGTVTTAQTTNLPTPALTRYTDGVGNMIMITIYSLIGTTATTATVGYKNQAGVSKTSKAFAIGATGLREAQRSIIVPLADGDTGVTEIENLDLVATTGTAGNIGISIIHPLAVAHVDNTGGGQAVDFITGFPAEMEIKEDACLSIIANPNSTIAPQVFLNLSFVEA